MERNGGNQRFERVGCAIDSMSVSHSCGRCRFCVRHVRRGRKAIMVFVLAIQMTLGGIIPQFIIYNQLGLLNKYSGLSLAYIAMVLPFAIWNMRGLFLNISKDIFESAAVEGANDWQILWKITFPLAASGSVSTSVFAFINAWNDYMIAYTFMKDQPKYTLPVWLSSFSTPTMGTDFGGQMAASVIFSLPVVVFFMLNAADPKVLDFAVQLIDEYAPLFRSRSFNIGGDETFDLGRGRSAQDAPGVSRDELYAGFVKGLCDVLAKRGPKPMLWADIALESPRTMDLLPADITMLNWMYEPDIDESKIRTIAEQGRRQFVCRSCARGAGSSRIMMAPGSTRTVWPLPVSHTVPRASWSPIGVITGTSTILD